MFKPDKEYLVTFYFDGGELRSQQLNCWASDPSLSKEVARSRLAYQRGLGENDLERFVVKEIIEL